MIIALFGLLQAAQAAPSLLAHPRALTAAEKAVIKTIVSEGLKDPMSAQFQWYPLTADGIYCGRVNAKNSYGGYTGFRVFSIFYNKSDGIQKALRPAILGEDDILSSVMTKQCTEAGYHVEKAP